ncbi:Di- and tricarboxylate antiporter [Edwardsiella anguillarum]|uniref:anion permease n=1 Tax=Edwardsiella TaxID=635 RepID=UPI0005EEC788|nr:anion permease [Edwardsiella anguillarum]AKM46224.1 citrate:succinate antiporter [Edwardsiella sp. EA181011]RFT04729.1 anion permease [Edwardsiella anguillarum]WHP80524.1 anion permease [Edwardsiella anguillarum]WHQ13904.1 anion permease [Edwardsiella anguillarum]WHQ18023.1 anion permease [Edwardsiella anguillarum]
MSKEKIGKLLAPLVVMGIMFMIPVPEGMPPQAWHYFAVFVAMIVGMILEPIPATAISFIAVTIVVIGNQFLLFDAKELADPAFDASKQALKWGLAGFSSTTVWLVFGAFIFALGYEVSGLGRRIALLLVKFMGKRTLTLGYAIVIIDILLAPFTPSNTARTGGTVFPVIKNLPPLFDSHPNDPSSRRIGSYLMWMMVISTSISSSMFVTGAAPNVLGLEFVSKIAGIQISWMQWFLGFLPVGLLLLIVAPWLSYVLYKPTVTHSEQVATWAGSALKEMGALTRREITLICLVLLSLALWVFGDDFINATAVALLAVALMLALHVVPWKDVTKYSGAWNTLVNLSTLVVMANGLTRSGFIEWFAKTMSTHLAGFSPTATVIALVLVFYFAHYLFASLTAHTATMLPVILAVAQSIPGVPMDQLCLLLVLSIGLMGCLTPYATGPGIIIYGCGYVKSQDYWRLGAIFGVIYIAALLGIGWPIMAMWN